MIFSQKMTKWCLFGAFFFFMPSIYYAIAAFALFAPIHMVSLMFMGIPFIFMSLLNLAVYLPLYYGLSAFLTRKIFKISHIQVQQALIILLLASMGSMGSIGHYGWPSSFRSYKPSHQFSWLQIILHNKRWIEMYVSPRGNIAPGQVTIGVRTNSFPKGDELYAWDLDEDGETEIQGPHKRSVEHTYQQPGLYHPRVVVTDSEGTTYKATIEVPIHDRMEFESKLTTQWKALWSALANRDEGTLKQYTTDHFRKKHLAGFLGSSYLTEKMASRYSAPLSIVENYHEAGRWIIILQSTLESPTMTKQIPVEVRFEYDPDPYDYDNSNPYRIFEYRELPEDYSLESHLSSQWSHMIQALEEGNIKGAITYFSKHEQKYFKRSFHKYWMSKENPYLKRAHVLRVPLTLIKMETGKLTLEGFASQEEPAPSSKIRVEFVRKYGNLNRISSLEVLPSNEQFESELNSLWMAMWDALALKHIGIAYKYVQYSKPASEFFYLSHTDKKFLALREWTWQKVDWTLLAKKFQVPLKLVDRCDNRISLVHVFPSAPGNQNQTYLEVNFSRNSFEPWKFNPWKIEQYHLYSLPLPDSFANALKDKTKGKDFDLCVQNEELVTKDASSISDRIRHFLGFQ